MWKNQTYFQNKSLSFGFHFLNLQEWILHVCIHLNCVCVCAWRRCYTKHTQRSNEDGWDSTHTSPRLLVIDEPEGSKVTETLTVCVTFSFSLTSLHCMYLDFPFLIQLSLYVFNFYFSPFSSFFSLIYSFFSPCSTFLCLSITNTQLKYYY